MTLEIFVGLLMLFSTITGLSTECAKNILKEQNVEFSSNLLAFIIALFVGIGGTITYYVAYSIQPTGKEILFVILMGFATAVGSMVGYDKVIQTIKQVNKL